MEQLLEEDLCQLIEKCKIDQAAEKDNRRQLILRWLPKQLIRYPKAELKRILIHLNIYMQVKRIEPIAEPLSKVYSNVELSTIVYSAISQYDNTSRKDCAVLVKELFKIQYQGTSVESINKKMNVIRRIPGLTNNAVEFS